MYSESAAEDLLGSTKQNDDKKVTQRLLPSVIASCSQVAMQSRRRLGSPQLYCLCSYVIDAFAFVGKKEKVRPCYFTTIFTVNLAKAWTPEIFLERN